MEERQMNKNCHNCGNAYPNYLHYIEGPCDYFGDEGEDWEGRDVLKDGCKFWVMSNQEIQRTESR